MSDNVENGLNEKSNEITNVFHNLEIENGKKNDTTTNNNDYNDSNIIYIDDQIKYNNELIVKDKIQFNAYIFLKITLIIGTFNFIFCFVLYVLNDNLDKIPFYLPTISETGAVGILENIIFTYCSHLISFTGAVIYFAVFLSYDDKISKLKEDEIRFTNYSYFNYNHLSFSDKISNLNYWNFKLLIIGLTSLLCLSIMGSVKVTLDVIIHDTFAFLFFLLSIIHMVIMFYVLRQYCLISIKQMLYHKYALWVCVHVNVVLVSLFLLIIILSNGTLISGDIFIDYVHPILEYTTFIALMIYLKTFKSDLRAIRVNFSHKINEE
jgi:hypothetical protein